MNAKPKYDRILTGLGLAGAAAVLAFVSNAGLAQSMGEIGEGVSPGPELPMSITLQGTVRDFKERTVEGGHTDFERKPTAGFGHYSGNVADVLDENHKPAFTGSGKRVSTQWRDAEGNNICYTQYNPSLGDLAGAWGTADPGGIASQDSFRQWWRDVPGVNLSAPLSITLARTEGSNVYVFDDRTATAYAGMGGFFPINGQMFGNSPGNDRNFHFTFELDTEFTYNAGTGQVFTFRGDDDVFVFIDDKLVIDIGGVHSAVTQSVHLDRLDFLEDGHVYSLRFFFAERHRTQSNFRIETTIALRNGELPTDMSMYD